MKQEPKSLLERQEKKEDKSILKVKAISKAYKVPNGKVGVLQQKKV